VSRGLAITSPIEFRNYMTLVFETEVKTLRPRVD